MRLRAVLFAMLTLPAAGSLAYAAADRATDWFERTINDRIVTALTVAGEDWAAIRVDGLQVTLTGEAPDETGRFRATELIRRVAPLAALADASRSRRIEPLAPPGFALELLRNEAEISLIGLVPDPGADARGLGEIRDALHRAGLAEVATDMLETAAFDAPAGWVAARDFALGLVADLPRTKISVLPGKVAVTAVADTAADRDALAARISSLRPEGVALSLDISAPRPVIAPFEVVFTQAEGAASLDACAAESDEAAATILNAARAAGDADAADCAIGLGAPVANWAVIAAAGIDAVVEIGGGAFAIRDFEAMLSAPPDLAPDRVTALAERFEARLPEGLTLTLVTAPTDPEVAEPAPTATARFNAVLQDDGAVRLSGAVQDATSREAIENYAASLFGYDRVVNATLIDPALPEGWPGRVLAGVEALSRLEEGALEITRDTMALNGWGLSEDVNAEVQGVLAAKEAGLAEVSVTYDAAKAEIATRTPPELCAAAVGAILQTRQITFAAGASEIAPASGGVLAAISDVLGGCPGAHFEIGGHTDSQGRAEANMSISEARARAVRDALAPDLPLVILTARGHGAQAPIAPNTSADGRARNRRITFDLIGVAGDPQAPAPLTETERSAEAAQMDEAAMDGTEILRNAPWPLDRPPRPREIAATHAAAGSEEVSDGSR